eukprot:TRINITY_DN5697_c1_g1_i1.p1 TRINITY_DN5697_c1_g1~~TRINITY_DN5697_c1_g1_i1.p1  ORF type:complete len:380 (+),score=121.99 TRINITY_DN5697_c1_g1_i1:439-1578(+)
MDVNVNHVPKRCPSNPGDAYMYYSMTPGFVKTDGNPIVYGWGGGLNVTNPADGRSPLNCGSFINGSYYYVQDVKLYVVKDTWDSETYETHVTSEFQVEIPRNFSNPKMIGNGNKTFFYTEFPENLGYMDAATKFQELPVPNAEVEWSDVIIFNGSFYLVVPISGIDTIFQYNSRLQVEKLAELSNSTSNQAKLYNVSNILWVYSFPRIFWSKNGRNFTEFSRSENFEAPIIFHKEKLYFSPLFQEISPNSPSRLIGNFTNCQIFNTSVWMFDLVNGQSIWSTYDLDTGHVTHFNVTFGDTIPVLIGNGAAVAPIESEISGFEPGILPGPQRAIVPWSTDEDEDDPTWTETTADPSVVENHASMIEMAMSSIATCILFLK